MKTKIEKAKELQKELEANQGCELVWWKEDQEILDWLISEVERVGEGATR